jgi:hypothetical protein
MLKALWIDDGGVILSAEIVLIGTILVLGMIVGMVELETSICGELHDLANAVGNLSQSYQYAGFVSSADGGHVKARIVGAAYNDALDLCDCKGSLNIVCNDLGEDAK